MALPDVASPYDHIYLLLSPCTSPLVSTHTDTLHSHYYILAQDGTELEPWEQRHPALAGGHHVMGMTLGSLYTCVLIQSSQEPQGQLRILRDGY